MSGPLNRAGSKYNQKKTHIKKASLKVCQFHLFPWSTLRQSLRNLNFRFPWQPLSEEGKVLFCANCSQQV